MKQWVNIAKQVFDIEIQGLKEVQQSLNHTFNELVEILADCKGRIVITGIGKSGLVGRKIAATLSSTGSPAFFMHPVEGAHGDLGMLQKEDIVLAISNSGETDELNAILPSLKAIGLKIIGLTSNPHSTMAKLCDLVLKIKVSREACPLNLAPTSSTTAILVTGDALAACLIQKKQFKEQDFKRYHPAGALGQRLSENITSLMHSNVPTIQQDMPLTKALIIMNDYNFGIIFVVNEKKQLLGVFTDGDLRRIASKQQLDFKKNISAFMTKKPKFVLQTEKAAKALDIMEEHQITVLPVLNNREEKKILGIIHLHDLLGKGKFKFSV
ncbi:MAG: KpsF/GutQ family sugar-phosphate isomerase [Desulfonauticus sp.]|nr:KpsF/GutQ family sugar-phosphate isomerase [Desulfonauticus sp.]